MARSQVSTAVKVIGAGAAVIVGGAVIGYLFGNVRETHPAQQTTQPTVSSTLAPVPSVNPSTIHPHTANGNYTAPGAPHIVIEEESQPILRRVTPPATPTPDPEASQEATKPTVVPTPSPAVKPADAANSGQSGTTPVTSPAAGGTETNSGSSAAPAPAPASPPPPPADPDFEHVNGPKPAPSGSPDPESGQQGGAPGQRTQNDDGRNDGKVQFRVQTGAYTDESNARSVADSLRSQGYATSTRSEQDGDHLVYKVQVGAYRSKTGASRAADLLQKKGYPAYVSPIAE